MKRKLKSIIKTTLKTRVLSFCEAHPRVLHESVAKAFPHEDPEQVERTLRSLQREGWIKINKSFTEDGYKIDRPVVYRTKKQLFTQQTLFEI